MFSVQSKDITGLDMNATGAQIGKLINESGMNDKQLGKIMHLSVQSINKWRHGRSLPDIENMFIMSRILGIKVDDFLVPLATRKPMIEVEIEAEEDSASMLRRLNAYAMRFREMGMPKTRMTAEPY